MYLYNLTVSRATGITHAVHGNFSGTDEQEIAISRGKILELVRPDCKMGNMHTLLTVELFGIIRSMMSFRFPEDSKDYLMVGSDSGRIVFLEYNAEKNVFEKETFGKSACKHILPGQYLAIDPGGRAVMIGSVERQKIVHILGRDAAARLIISSPLEVHKSHTVVYDMVGVDVEHENPTFACLEMNYEKADKDPTGEAALTTQQTLTFYVLDIEHNNFLQTYSKPLEGRGNFLISVPGGDYGPSGVLICSENYITYKNYDKQSDIHCSIPRRQNDLDDPEREMIFVCNATYKSESMFFFFAQTEQGDIFKITLETDENNMVSKIILKYFDTVPVASAMCILKNGFLFVASEFGNHYLYQIAHLCDEPDDESEFSSAMRLEEGETFFFSPRTLKNLIVVEELESLSPIMHCHVGDLASEDAPQLYMACGRGPRSSLRVLRHGLEVSEMAVTKLPGSPNAVWTVKRTSDDEYDAYIIVSFMNSTLVLSIGETVEEVTDSGLWETVETLACVQMGDVLVQIYPTGVRYITADKRVTEWPTPENKTVSKCAVNEQQVVVALTGGELVCFEMDLFGDLIEHNDRIEMPADVICMALASTPSGDQKSRFLAVGFADNTVRILSLETSNFLSFLSMQRTCDIPESVAIVEMGGEGSRSDGALCMSIGLQNGMLIRVTLDKVSGRLSDAKTRYLGSLPVKLFKVCMRGNDTVVATSDRSWLCYCFQNLFHLTPLCYETLEFASGFSSRQCPEGIVAISDNSLRILALEKLGAVFNQVTIPLEYTPRKFVIHPETHYLILIETDHSAYTEKTKMMRKQQMAEKMVEAAEENEQELAADMANDFLSENLPETVFGAPRGGTGMWASVIVVLDPIDGKTIFKVPLEQNEAAFSVCLVRFANQSNHQFLLVGIAKDLHLCPRYCNSGVIHTYKVLNEGKNLELVHKTEVDDIPGAICPFQGRALVGVGNLLRIYDLGKKKLLKKCENRHLPNEIVTIHSAGSRIIVGDAYESVFFIDYKCQENQLSIFADDTNSRQISTVHLLDCNTIACADKLGNINVIRLPAALGDDREGEQTVHGAKVLGNKVCSQKVEVIANFYVGEIVLSLQKAILAPGGSESLVYTTLSGTVGVLTPFAYTEDRDFFELLEKHMRSKNPPLCGRNHLSFRSSFFSVKNVVDGDLCEQFNSLDPAKQKAIAEDLCIHPNEVSNKLEEIRTRYAF